MKNRQVDVDEFLKQEKLAVVGVSRNKKKFGNQVFHNLMKKGYKAFAVNANAESIDGQPCYPDLKSLPEAVGGAVLVVPPAQTEKVVKEAKEAGITRIWMQLGSVSDEAVAFCRENDMLVVRNECIFMFPPLLEGFHKIHWWLWKIFGKLPQ